MKPVKWTTRLKIKFMRWQSSLGQKTSSRGEVHVFPTSAGKTRIFLFKPADVSSGLLPVYVNMHGGGSP